MWISKNNSWVKRTTDLEKFLTERIIQRCDYQEVLSNQHRTVNGYTLINELLNLAILAKTRGRTIHTVMVLFEEANSSKISQTVINDPIIVKYFSDIRTFISDYTYTKLFNKDTKQPELNELDRLIHKLKIFKAQLEKGYFDSLRREFFSIDYADDDHFMRKADYISSLIDLLIPYLVFKGYAVSSLSEVLKSWIEKKYHINIKRVFRFFDLKNREYEFAFRIGAEFENDAENILNLLRVEVNSEIKYGAVEDLKREFDSLDIFKEKDRLLIYRSNKYIDPHSHFRTIYDRLLKRIVLRREAQSLNIFNSFFASCFWRLPKKGKYYHNVSLVNDPINVVFRGKTLVETFVICCNVYNFDFKSKDFLPELENPQLNSSLYYYNLALGSKSIENSLSLLWTSLEALLPYRFNYSDIECVQSFVSKSLCLGSLNRDIVGLADRIIQTNKKGNKALDELLIDKTLLGNIMEKNSAWYKWLIDISNKDKKFELLQGHSNLMAYEYTRIAKSLATDKLKKLHYRIERSCQSIRFQLQRIYLHRNQIVHAGNLINEYTNLWMHLEWYVGKLLAYSIIKLEITKEYSSIEDVFTDIEADYEFVTSYLKYNETKEIRDLSDRVKRIILQYSWQSF